MEKTNSRDEHKISFNWIDQKYDLVIKRNNEEQFVRRKCDNFQENKGQMISSFLNRIVLVRILITKSGEERLITDPDCTVCIMEETNKLFQTCAGGSNYS